MKCIYKLAPDYTVVARSEHPQTEFLGSPGLCKLPDGSILATHDVYPDGKKPYGIAFRSTDGGNTWVKMAEYPFYHARPFLAGKSLYILGHQGDLTVLRSDDLGLTWGEPVKLTDGQDWHQAPTNYVYANGCIYLVMERSVYSDCAAWNVSTLAPVLMRGKVDADLTKRENWTFASELAFRDLVNDISGDAPFGVPFYATKAKENVTISETPSVRKCAPIGWLETNVVQFHDPDHIWYDESGHTFHLWMRAHTGKTGYAAILQVKEMPDGSLVTQPVLAPSGKPIVYLPFPCGQMKFHIVYDEVSRLYWLLGTQATDSMIRPEAMPATRYGLPDNERQRLVLHFSKNCVDWCFAGLVDAAEPPVGSRHYASMAIDGEDLLILARSGDAMAKSAHNGNLITYHKIPNFRELIY